MARPVAPRTRVERLKAQTVPVAVLSATAPPADLAVARAGRRAALVMAGTGALWALVTFAGSRLGWDNRSLAFFDLLALAGFAFALYLTWGVWRLRRAARLHGG